MSDVLPPGLILSETGKASRPRSCRDCFYADKRANATKPPPNATPEEKAWLENRAICRHANPGTTDKANQRARWKFVHLDEDWCGAGTV
jgi:hypothetical protein